jgi:hypothetical protein
MERGPLNLVSIIEELLERKSSGSGLENGDYGHRGSAAITSPTSGVRSQTQATELLLLLLLLLLLYFNLAFDLKKRSAIAQWM